MAAPGFVQGAGVNSAASVTTKSVTLAANPLPGNLLVLYTSVDTGATITGVSSTGDGSWTASGALNDSHSLTSAIQVFYVLSTVGGTNAATVTVTTAAGSNIVIGVHEVGGLIGWKLDTAASYRHDDVNTVNPVTPALTNVSVPAYVFAFDNEGSTTTSCNAPFTFRVAISGGHGTADQFVRDIASRACTFIAASATDAVGTIIFTGNDPVIERFNPLPLMSPGRI